MGGFETEFDGFGFEEVTQQFFPKNVAIFSDLFIFCVGSRADTVVIFVNF